MQARGGDDLTALPDRPEPASDWDSPDHQRSAGQRGSVLSQVLLLVVGVGLVVGLLWQTYGLHGELAALRSAQETQMQRLIDRIAELQDSFAERHAALEAQAQDRISRFESVVDSRIGRMREQAEAAQAAVEALNGDVASIAARQDQLNTVTLALQKSLAEIAQRLDRYAPGPAPTNFQFWRATPGHGSGLIVITAYGTEAEAAAQIARLALAFRSSVGGLRLEPSGPQPVSARLALPGEYLPVLKTLSAKGDAPASLVVAHTLGLGGAEESEAREAVSYLGTALAQVRLTRFDGLAADTSAGAGAAPRSRSLGLASARPAAISLLSVDSGLLETYLEQTVGRDALDSLRALFTAPARRSDAALPLAATDFGRPRAQAEAGASGAAAHFTLSQAARIADAVRTQVRAQVAVAEEALALAARLAPEKGTWVHALRYRVHALRRATRSVLADGRSGLSLFCASVLQPESGAHRSTSARSDADRARCRRLQETLGASDEARRFFRDASALELALQDLGAQLAAPAGATGGAGAFADPSGSDRS